MKETMLFCEDIFNVKSGGVVILDDSVVVVIE